MDAPRAPHHAHPTASGSNAARIAALESRGTPSAPHGLLDAAFDAILGGDWDGAQAAAHAVAETARAEGDDATVDRAGIAWQIAAAFESSQDAMEARDFSSAQVHAARAADRARSLRNEAPAYNEDLTRIVDSAGTAWSLAEETKKTAGGTGRTAPLVDQHQLDHWNRGAFCGIATMIMILRANGIEQESDTTSLDALASRVYHPGQGTSGQQMAGVLRERGLKGSAFTTQGTRGEVLETLAGGQALPLGVVRVEGTVMQLEGGASERYAFRRVGDHHEREFPGSGHWVLVTGFEGSRDKPTAFHVNDPDLGGTLRCTPAQLDSMGAGSGSFWMVHQGSRVP